MAIVGNNSILNQYVPTFYIKNLTHGQILKFDSTKKAFINVDGGSFGAQTLGDLSNVSGTVDNPLSVQPGQVLTYNASTSLWENKFVDYNTLLNKPNNNDYSFAGLSDTAKPSLPSGYVKWNSTGTQLVYLASIPAGDITGLAEVATTGDYNDLINKPVELPISLTGDITGSGVNSIVTTLSDVNSNIGTFGNDSTIPRITVDSKGRITGVIEVPIAQYGVGSVTSVSASGNNGVLASVINSTTTPAISISLGDILPSSVTSAGIITGSNLSGINTGDQVITLTGDITGSGTSTFVTTLATVNSAPGVYGSAHVIPVISVNEKGLVTSVATQHIDDSVRDYIEIDRTYVVESRHQYIVTSELEVDGCIENYGVIAIL